MNIIENKKIWFSISIAIMVVGLISFFINGFNMGIDFTGGSLLEIEVHEEKEISSIREILDKYDTNANIGLLGPNKSIVQIRSIKEFDKDLREDIFNEFKTKYNLEENEPLRVDHFGPSIGKEIQKKAFIAIFLSAIGMLIYIAFRFEWRFAIAAIIALLHDIIVLIAVYAIFRIPINNPFVAAMLTVLGYSINDTIVIFDRIRENLKFMKKHDYSKVANDSVNETMSRSINTSITTLVTIAALYFLGADQVKEFALPLMVGVVAGTYSSVFIASPIWVMLKDKQRGKTTYKPRYE